MKPEPLVPTSAGMETATQTVERIKKRMEPIKADKLGTTPAFVPPPAPSKDAALTRLESSITPPEPSQQPQQQPNLRDSLVTRQLAALEKLGTRGARTQEVMEDQQVLQRQQALDATDRNIATRERYYENRLRNLEDKGGGLKIGLESETNTIRRERARELADLYIIRAGQNQEVETARQYANDLIAAEFEPLKEEMQYTSQLYTMLANDLTDSEKLQVQQQMTEKNNNIAYAQQTSQQIYNELINSGAYTPERGQILKDAMAEASLAIQNGQSPQAAIAKMQSTMQGVQTLGQLQMEAARANIANTYDQIAARAEQNKALLGTLNGKAQTESERQAELYANRMLEADAIINQIGADFAKPEALFGQYAPNMLKTPDRQRFEQAQRNFINAVLRKESGAVISDEEFANARMQYFPQPGDSAGVLAQKAQNRTTAIQGLYNTANVPMPELSAPQPLGAGTQGVTSTGLSYTIISQ